MEWFRELILGSGVPHSIFVLALVIAIGTALGKVKIAGISLGMTWILFIGIAASHFGMRLDPKVLHFVKEFGLILFVYCIGMQVGPGFFSSFKKGGLKLNALAVMIVLLGAVTAYTISMVTGTSLSTLVGVLSGAVTNTPGLGAAQQAYLDSAGVNDPTISMGYAVAYPIGVIGTISVILILRSIFKVNIEKEHCRIEAERGDNPAATSTASVLLKNSTINGHKVVDVRKQLDPSFVISRIMKPDGEVILADGQSVLSEGDRAYVVAEAKDIKAVVEFLGKEVEIPEAEWKKEDKGLVSRRVLVTKSQINGRSLGDLKLRSDFGVNVTRVNRAGVDLAASANLHLQIGDRVTVVGDEVAVQDVSRLLGNSMKRLREPNLIPIFIGILLGVLLGSIPIHIGSMSVPVKLGLAGGPLVVAILVSRFGPKFHLVTYTTMSANLMLREVGISLFLAAVGLGSGEGFVETVVNGGYTWIAYGAIITIIPVFITGFIALKWLKVNYFSVMGLISGSMTSPFALSFSSGMSPNDIPAVSYSTVYPLTMFMRVLSAQVLVLMAI